MGDHAAFFYGTLMAREVLYRVIYGKSNITEYHPAFARSKLLTIQDAILHNYCRHHVRHAEYPGMIPEKGHSVRGTYVTGLTDYDFFRLDWFEGSEYTMRKVRPKLLENGVETQEVEAETYMFKYPHKLEKGVWDYEDFRKNKIHHWADDSSAYDGKSISS
ncbi:hypothetical protein BJ878DRAFT_418098 [Calycina marina]|uniref:Putative gamma-glutamylcyclotransferase n=1 Tax=Calycina marina TaxID=1763456 RepID=A0A9P7Z5E4_9HELO|nr:hypothetical protein BJ878DRAFT_418098 [Calycina marina]